MAANPNDPIRHNPDLDAAFGDLDDAAGKLADAAGKLSEAAGKRGVTDPIRHNPDLDAAFGGGSAAGSAAQAVSPPGPSGATTAQPVGGGSGGGSALGALAALASAIPGPVGAVGRGVSLVSGLLGGGGGGGGGSGGGSPPAGPSAGGSSGGGLGGLVSGLSGPGASGVAETAQKVAGMIPVVGDVIQGLMKFTRAVIDGADAQHKLNMQYADYSAAMAGVLAEAEMRDWQRNREIGDKTADTARDLAESRANYQDNMGKVEALFSNVKNEVFSKLLDVLNTVLEPIAQVLDNINDVLFTQAEDKGADKWLDDVVAKTKARQQAGDDWFRVRRGGD